MKKLGVLILLSIFLISFIYAQEQPASPIDNSDAQKIQDAVGAIPLDDSGKFDASKLDKPKSLAEARIEGINIWLNENAEWVKVIFGMVPEISWIFTLNFLLILIFLVNFRNILVFYSSLSENSATIVGIMMTIVFIQLKITVKSATGIVGLFSQWWFKAIIIVGAIVLIYFSGGLAKIAKKRREMLAKSKEEIDRIRLEGARKSAEEFTKGINEGLSD